MDEPPFTHPCLDFESSTDRQLLTGQTPGNVICGNGSVDLGLSVFWPQAEDTCDRKNMTIWNGDLRLLDAEQWANHYGRVSALFEDRV